MKKKTSTQKDTELVSPICYKCDDPTVLNIRTRDGKKGACRHHAEIHYKRITYGTEDSND